MSRSAVQRISSHVEAARALHVNARKERILEAKEDRLTNIEAHKAAGAAITPMHVLQSICDLLCEQMHEARLEICREHRRHKQERLLADGAQEQVACSGNPAGQLGIVEECAAEGLCSGERVIAPAQLPSSSSCGVANVSRRGAFANSWRGLEKLYCAPPRENAHGIPNKGGTCFLNVAMQILLRIEPFVKLLESKVKATPKAETSAPSIFVREVLGQAEAWRGEAVGTYSPEGWVHFIRQGAVCGKAFKGRGQHDVMEAILKTKEEVGGFRKHSKEADAAGYGIDDIFGMSYLERAYCASPACKRVNWVKRLCEGQIFLDAASWIAHGTKLEDMIANLFQPEILHGRFCSICKDGTVLRSIAHAKGPPILLIEFKRRAVNTSTNTYEGYKIDSGIDCPRTLDVGKYFSGVYELCAVSLHTADGGQANAGHVRVICRGGINPTGTPHTICSTMIRKSRLILHGHTYARIVSGKKRTCGCMLLSAAEMFHPSTSLHGCAQFFTSIGSFDLTARARSRWHVRAIHASCVNLNLPS